jgi:hypothetical protein
LVLTLEVLYLFLASFFFFFGPIRNVLRLFYFTLLYQPCGGNISAAKLFLAELLGRLTRFLRKRALLLRLCVCVCLSWSPIHFHCCLHVHPEHSTAGWCGSTGAQKNNPHPRPRTRSPAPHSPQRKQFPALRLRRRRECSRERRKIACLFYRKEGSRKGGVFDEPYPAGLTPGGG